MIHTGQTNRDWEQGPVTIRALRSLTRQAFEAVRDAICAVPGNWTLEQHADYDGYLSLLVSSEGDSHAAIYVISGRLGQIELARFQDDQLRTLGQFADIEAAIAELINALPACRNR